MSSLKRVDALRAAPRITALEPGLWYRVHSNKRPGDSFNPSAASNARFSVVRREDNSVGPVLYAAQSIEGALMETVFHEAPIPAAGAQLREADIVTTGYALSTIRIDAALSIIDLASVGLRRIGLRRAQVIDTMPSAYPATRATAEHLYRLAPAACGLEWISRQHDRSRSIILFGDRVGTNTVRLEGATRSVLDPDIVHHVLDLVDALDMRYLAL